VNQARVTQIAKQKFVHLTRPRRPPFPGTPTPPGYVIHNKGIVPNDATGLEKLRDFLLMVLTHRFVGILQLAWVIALVAVFIVFVCCMFYWFGWGEVTDESWGCTRNSTCCTCDPPALTYSLEDYWQEKMTQCLSALFTYSALIAAPWRVGILCQCFSSRCRGKDGVNFYGLSNEMPFFHMPRGPRLAIALLLNLGILMQLIHQVTHFVWHDVVQYFEQPQGLISVATGPIAGCLTGAPAAIIQIYWDNKLHSQHPHRFPPGLVQAIRAQLKQHDSPEGPPQPWRRRGSSSVESLGDTSKVCSSSTSAAAGAACAPAVVAGSEAAATAEKV